VDAGATGPASGTYTLYVTTGGAAMPVTGGVQPIVLVGGAALVAALLAGASALALRAPRRRAG